MIKWQSALLGGILMFLWGGCALQDEDSGSFQLYTYEYDFDRELYNWQGDFADYSINDSAFYSFQFAYTDLPPGLEIEGKSLMLGCDNRKSSGPFMFLKKKIESLRENTEYTISYNVEFFSNASKLSANSDYAPGTSVYLKAGATREEPKKLLVSKSYVLNFDKGDKDGSGSDMILIGDISTEEDTNNYVLLKRRNANPFSAVSNDQGELWLIIGLDSSMEGITKVYFTNITAVVSIAD